MPGAYEILDVHKRERFTPGGSRVSYYEIGMVTALGATGTLRIKEIEYKKETLAGTLAAFAKELDRAFSA